MPRALSLVSASRCTGKGTPAPTTDQFATPPASNRQGSSGPTPASGSLGDATRIIPSGTPTFGNSRADSRGFAGVAATLTPVRVVTAGNGVAEIRSEVASVDG